jgi:predicted permease
VFFQRLNLPPDRYSSFKEDMLDRLRAIPGVDSATLTYEIPLRSGASANVWMDGADARQGTKSNLGRVGPDYFKTLQIPLLAGREFDARDKVGALNVAIVNEAFARKFLNGASPVGQRFWIEGMFGGLETRYEIIGLAPNTKQGNLREEFHPLAYTAAAQDPHTPPGGPVLIRSRLPQTEIVAAVKRILHEINPAITVNFQGFKSIIEATIVRERLMVTLSGFFGLLALLLACIGLYGILSYGVAGRTTEIGIRMALGAERRDVFWLILREALLLVIAGVTMGLPLIFAVARLASTLLFGLTPTDPVSLLLTALLMLAVAMVAGYLPARRATRVDPMEALRHE